MSEFDELIAATDRVAPRADFTAHVMDAVQKNNEGSDPNFGFFADLPRVAKRVVPALVLAAAASAFFAYRATRDADEAAIVGTPADQIVAGALDLPAEDSE